MAEGAFSSSPLLHTSSPGVSAHCLESDILVGDMLECFWDLYYCFGLPRGNKVDCTTDIGWGEFDRITTRGLGEVREMLRMNFWDGTNAETSRGWYLVSDLARMKSINDYIEFINREKPHGMMWLKFKSCWCLFVPVEPFIYVTWFLVMWHKLTPQ